MAATDVVSSLQREVELAKEGLKNVDENIKKLTGRDPSEARGPVGNRRVVVKRNFGERIGGPPQKRFNAGNAYNRLGPRLNERNNRRFGQLESDGEEEEDDGKKPTLQSSIVATPAPSRQQQEAKTDKKTQTRNKRMFGVLLGTLQKFKENSSKEAARERRRKQIEKKLEEAAVKEREEAIRRKKELFFTRREQQTKLQELERKIEIAEMLEEWEDHDRKLSKFIRTNTKPHIFYLPAKHNDYTQGLLEKTAEHVEDAIKKRREEIEEVLRKPVNDDRDVAHDDFEGEPGHESIAHEDHEEPDIKQEVEHSDDEGNTRKKRVKAGRREVILTSAGRGKSRINEDELEENKEEGELGDEEVTSERRTVGMSDSERKVKSEEKDVEEQADSRDETEELRAEKERERDVEMSEVNEGKEESEEKEVEEKNDTNVDIPEEKALGTKVEEVIRDIGVNRDLGGEAQKGGESSEIPPATVTEGMGPTESSERSIDMCVERQDTQQSQSNTQDDEQHNESESKMHIDPGPEQDNLE